MMMVNKNVAITWVVILRKLKLRIKSMLSGYKIIISSSESYSLTWTGTGVMEVTRVTVTMTRVILRLYPVSPPTLITSQERKKGERINI